MATNTTRAQRAQRTPEAAVIAAPAPSPALVNADAGPRADAHGPLGPMAADRVRKPLGQLRMKLDNSVDPTFHRQWFNDDKDRIKDALEAGYAHMLDEQGKPRSRVVGTKKEGGPLVAYRMEIPIEFWQEDQDQKVAVRRQRQHEMQSGATGRGQPGEDGRYVPKGPDGRPLTQVRHEAR